MGLTNFQTVVLVFHLRQYVAAIIVSISIVPAEQITSLSWITSYVPISASRVLYKIPYHKKCMISNRLLVALAVVVGVVVVVVIDVVVVDIVVASSVVCGPNRHSYQAVDWTPPASTDTISVSTH
jgi:hypothetical protein